MKFRDAADIGAVGVDCVVSSTVTFSGWPMMDVFDYANGKRRKEYSLFVFLEGQTGDIRRRLAQLAYAECLLIESSTSLVQLSLEASIRKSVLSKPAR